MQQFTLDNWLSIKKKNYNIKKYFYINWESEFIPNKPIWLSKKPSKINFIRDIKWSKKNKDFKYYICGYFNNIDIGQSIIKEKKYKNTSYLKSHLQKCIRRMNDTKSVKTANHFIKNNLNDFLRRLAIITLEDTFLIEEFNILIWIMVAISTKKFKIKNYILEWLLGYVCLLSLLKKKDTIKYTEIIKPTLKEKLDSYKNLNSDFITTLYCLEIRKSYGGMKGDMNLIDQYIKVWKERFNKNQIPNIYFEKVRPISLNIEILSLDDWELSAIDFHCYPKILDIINNKFNHISKSELKKIIWFNSSSINKRTNNEKCYKYSLFIEIKDFLNNLQRYLLNCYF